MFNQGEKKVEGVKPMFRLVLNYLVLSSFTFSCVLPLPATAGEGARELVELDSKFQKELLKQLRLSPEFDEAPVHSDIGIAIIDDDFGDEILDAGAYPEVYEVVHGYAEDGKKGYTPEFLTKNGLPTNPDLYPVIETKSEDLNVDLTGRKTTAKKAKRSVAHGLLVAQAVMGVIGRHTRVKFYFLNGDYQYNFAAAAYYARDLYRKGEIRTVVSSVGFTSAGLGNGRGPLDTIVGDVLKDRGLTWINAAGNDGGRVWAGKANRIKHSKYIEFRPGERNSDCLNFTNEEAGNDIQIILVWDGGQRELGEGTRVDYDVEVLDPAGRLMVVDSGETAPGDSQSKRGSSGSKIQVRRSDRNRVPPPPKPGSDNSSDSESDAETLNAEGELAGQLVKSKEEIELPAQPKTKRGAYCIRVRAESDFAHESDDLQVLIRSSSSVGQAGGILRRSINFQHANQVNEMFPPATAPGVISVGNNSPHSSRAKNSSGRELPHVLMEMDTIYLNDDSSVQGTSFTAPIFAGVKLFLESLDVQMTYLDIFPFLTPEPGPVTIGYLRSRPNGNLLVDKLLEQVKIGGITEDRLKAYLYPKDFTVVTMPDYPGVYFNQFPRAEVNQLHNYDYFMGLRSHRTGVVNPVAVPFSAYRYRGSEQRPAGLYPWENARLGESDPFNWGPYDSLQVEIKQGRVRNHREYTAADFLKLERETPLSTGEDSIPFDPYARPELALRLGTPRDSVRNAQWKTPTRAEFKAYMRGKEKRR